VRANVVDVKIAPTELDTAAAAALLELAVPEQAALDSGEAAPEVLGFEASAQEVAQDLVSNSLLRLRVGRRRSLPLRGKALAAEPFAAVGLEP